MTRLLPILLVVGCSGGDIEREPLPSDDCAAACAVLADCGRPEAEPAEDGTTCEELCIEVQGYGLELIDPACVVEAADCAAVDECMGL